MRTIQTVILTVIATLTVVAGLLGIAYWRWERVQADERRGATWIYLRGAPDAQVEAYLRTAPPADRDAWRRWEAPLRHRRPEDLAGADAGAPP